MPSKHNLTPPSDRLWPAVVWALLIHVVVVALIEWDGPSTTEPSTLDVVWVPTPPQRDERAPQEPDFLANADQAGGQDSTPQRPSEAMSGPGNDSGQASRQRADDPATPSERPAQDRQRTQPNRTLDLSGVRRGRDDLNWADRSQALEANPRHKRINAATQEHRFAAYMDAWIKKVERVGRLHYPQEARRRGLSGSLVLSVDLLPSGEVDQVVIERSSGHAFLDEAAREIVAMASPYAPLPIEPGELDRLTITRTWQFSSGGAFR